MQKLIITLILVFPLCVYSQTRHDLLNTADKFSPTGKTTEFEVSDYITKKETGILNGVAYEIYFFRGSGAFSAKKGASLEAGARELHWTVSCNRNPVDQQKHCEMSFRDLNVSFLGDNNYVVSVGRYREDDFSIAVRIDRRLAFQINGKSFAGEESRKIIEQLKTGKKVGIKFIESSNTRSTDDSFKLYGFNEAFQYINWAYYRIR